MCPPESVLSQGLDRLAAGVGPKCLVAHSRVEMMEPAPRQLPRIRQKGQMGESEVVLGQPRGALSVLAAFSRTRQARSPADVGNMSSSARVFAFPVTAADVQAHRCDEPNKSGNSCRSKDQECIASTRYRGRLHIWSSCFSKVFLCCVSACSMIMGNLVWLFHASSLT